MNFARFLKTFALSSALILGSAVADVFDLNGLYGLKYGPNVAFKMAGNTPFVWGQWLNQADATISFNWIEPLHDLPYGNPLDPSAAFLRASADVEISPFYGGFRLGIGGRPLNTNPQIEARFIYEHYTYFDSNVEMTLADKQKDGSGNIAESWTADWITNRLYTKESLVDFMQNFAFYFDLEYGFGSHGIIGLGLHYTLVDVSTQFTGKSYDYRRNIPVFSRDFIIELSAYAYVPVTEHWAFAGYLTQYSTGNSKSADGSYLKEPLGYMIVLGGPAFNWGDDHENKISLLGGVWAREKKRFYQGRLSQQFLVHLQYQRNFGFSIKPVPEQRYR